MEQPPHGIRAPLLQLASLRTALAREQRLADGCGVGGRAPESAGEGG